jgi:HAD superfamily hydrolase (TIGR01509 family)
MSFEGIIFDFDGVLCDSEKIHKECFMLSIESYGYKWCDLKESLYESSKNSKTKNKLTVLSKHELIDKNEINQINDFKQKITIEKIKNSKFDDKVKNLLLKNKNYKKFAIASDCNLNTINSFLISNEALSLFEVIVSSEHSGYLSKPAPAVYSETINKLKLPKNKIVVFEDSMDGIKAANLAGLKNVHQCTNNLLYDILVQILS